MKKLLLAFIITSFYGSSFSQSTKLYFGLSQSIGLSSQDVTIGNQTNEMGMTNMIGVNFGVGVGIVKSIEIVAGAGYYGHFVYNATRTNGNSNTSSESFNVKRLSFGLANTFEVNEKVGIRIDGGFDFNFPGKLNAKQGSSELGKISYGSSTGFYGHFGVPISMSDKLRIIPALGYRSAEFEAESYENGELFDLNRSLFTLEASSIEIGVSLSVIL